MSECPTVIATTICSYVEVWRYDVPMTRHQTEGVGSQCAPKYGPQSFDCLHLI